MTSLDLNDLRLEFLPEEVESFLSLRDLKMKNNRFLAVPWEVFQRLETFDFSENRVVDHVEVTWGTIFNDLKAFNTRTFAIYNFALSCITLPYDIFVLYVYLPIFYLMQLYRQSHDFRSFITGIAGLSLKTLSLIIIGPLYFFIQLLIKLRAAITKPIYGLSIYYNKELKVNWHVERLRLEACNQLAIQTFKLMSSV